MMENDGQLPNDWYFAYLCMMVQFCGSCVCVFGFQPRLVPTSNPTERQASLVVE